ncbi:MAG: PIN domain-containing protein [Glaciecola sp.]
MITLLLDTNILHQEGLASGNMQLLRRLVDASHVEVFIPEIVKKEFLTRRVMESKDKLKDAQNALSAVGKKVSKTSEAQTKTNDAQSSIKEIEEIIDKVVYEDFSQWEKDLSATILPFKTEVMVDVMEEYFSGGSVYRKPKSREDIPDAIINKSIDEVIAEKGQITIAIKDGAFKKHLGKDQRITLVDSLEEFLNFESNSNKISELDALSEKTGEVLEYLSGEDFSALFLKYLIRSDDEIGDIYLEDDDITIKDELEVDTFGERINFPQAKSVNNLVVDGVSKLSSTSYSLKVSFDANATLNYCAFYEGYMYIEKDTSRDVTMDSMNGDGICDLSELFEFKFRGYVVIEFKEELDIDAIKAHSRYLGTEANPITADIDIDTAEIVNA